GDPRSPAGVGHIHGQSTPTRGTLAGTCAGAEIGRIWRARATPRPNAVRFTLPSARGEAVWAWSGRAASARLSVLLTEIGVTRWTISGNGASARHASGNDTPASERIDALARVRQELAQDGLRVLAEPRRRKRMERRRSRRFDRRAERANRAELRMV